MSTLVSCAILFGGVDDRRALARPENALGAGRLIQRNGVVGSPERGRGR
jgi:transcription termination factor Rho